MEDKREKIEEAAEAIESIKAAAGPDTAGKTAAAIASAPAAPRAAPGNNAEVKFPVSFDLHIVYVIAEGADIVTDLEHIYALHGVSCAMIQGVSKPGAKYGKMGSRVTFFTREQMYATYADIGKLPYVKMAV